LNESLYKHQDDNKEDKLEALSNHFIFSQGFVQLLDHPVEGKKERRKEGKKERRKEGKKGRRREGKKERRNGGKG
jgi:hypothetical protein